MQICVVFAVLDGKVQAQQEFAYIQSVPGGMCRTSGGCSLC